MKKKILIVDDEEDILSMIKMRLEANNYEVITACDGNSGFDMARTENVNLIILDLTLPGMDGYQVCRLLKFDEKFKDIPIIMLTARGQQEDKQWGLKVKVDFYMTKPFEAKELLAKVKELLGE
ncbi:MAG: response regulator [Candidatus Omnitrophica bacterium]|nr:response regulator [Candidatus Omnitrophota bacterium]